MQAGNLVCAFLIPFVLFDKLRPLLHEVRLLPNDKVETPGDNPQEEKSEDPAENLPGDLD